MLPVVSPQQAPRLQVVINARTVSLHELGRNGDLLSYVDLLHITAEARLPSPCSVHTRVREKPDKTHTSTLQSSCSDMSLREFAAEPSYR